MAYRVYLPSAEDVFLGMSTGAKVQVTVAESGTMNANETFSLAHEIGSEATMTVATATNDISSNSVQLSVGAQSNIPTGDC